MKRTLLPIFVWLTVFGFWFVLSRGHHPTLLLDALATAVLVAASAACVYLNAFILQPRFARTGSWLTYASLLFTSFFFLDIATVVIIQTVYDRLWGADPLRYGFWTNVFYEAVFIGLHLIGAIAAEKYLTGKKQGEPTDFS